MKFEAVDPPTWLKCSFQKSGTWIIVDGFYYNRVGKEDGNNHDPNFFKLCCFGGGAQITKGHDIKSHIYCECTSNSFILTFGDYQVFAECKDCGLKECVHC